MMPSQVGAKTLMYRRDLFAAAGLDPDRPPRDWDELREMARQVADPSRGIYGVAFATGVHASWSMYNYLVSAGAEAVRQAPDGEWRAAFDSDEAVTAFEFVRELQKEEVEKGGRKGPLAYRGADFGAKWADGKVAMMFVTLSGARLGGEFNPQWTGAAPASRNCSAGTSPRPTNACSASSPTRCVSNATPSRGPSPR
jgi:ABC-type glycerol-3-phosphate transport system substrate-binding protein